VLTKKIFTILVILLVYGRTGYCLDQGLKNDFLEYTDEILNALDYAESVLEDTKSGFKKIGFEERNAVQKLEAAIKKYDRLPAQTWEDKAASEIKGTISLSMIRYKLYLLTNSMGDYHSAKKQSDDARKLIKEFSQ
jgi:hypothetical protein